MLLNEARMSDFGGIDLGDTGGNVNGYIVGSFVDSWRKYANVVPVTWLRGLDFKGQAVDNGDGSGHVILPPDFFRLVIFRMKGWKKPVFIPAMEGDDVSEMQWNLYARGGVVNPVCVLGKRYTGNKYIDILSYYSLPRYATHVVESAVYIPLARSISGLNDNDVLDVDDRFSDILCLSSASLVADIFEKIDLSKEFDRRVLEIISLRG